jgi:hypothetical protein
MEFEQGDLGESRYAAARQELERNVYDSVVAQSGRGIRLENSSDLRCEPLLLPHSSDRIEGAEAEEVRLVAVERDYLPFAHLARKLIPLKRACERLKGLMADCNEATRWLRGSRYLPDKENDYAKRREARPDPPGGVE